LPQRLFLLVFNPLIQTFTSFGEVMRGTVIEFPKHRTGEYRSKGARTSAVRAQKRPPRLKLQIERITRLLKELEGMAGHSSKVPPAMLARASASIYTAEQMLGLRDMAQSGPPILEEEGDPQPHVDHEALERLYDARDP
jgi:hypothetical protein